MQPLLRINWLRGAQNLTNTRRICTKQHLNQSLAITQGSLARRPARNVPAQGRRCIATRAALALAHAIATDAIQGVIAEAGVRELEYLILLQR